MPAKYYCLLLKQEVNWKKKILWSHCHFFKGYFNTSVSDAHCISASIYPGHMQAKKKTAYVSELFSMRSVLINSKLQY